MQTFNRRRQISFDKIPFTHLPVKRISIHRKGVNVTAAKQAASYTRRKRNMSVIRTGLGR